MLYWIIVNLAPRIGYRLHSIRGLYIITHHSTVHSGTRLNSYRPPKIELLAN